MENQEQKEKAKARFVGLLLTIGKLHSIWSPPMSQDEDVKQTQIEGRAEETFEILHAYLKHIKEEVENKKEDKEAQTLRKMGEAWDELESLLKQRNPRVKPGYPTFMQKVEEAQKRREAENTSNDEFPKNCPKTNKECEKKYICFSEHICFLING